MEIRIVSHHVCLNAGVEYCLKLELTTILKLRPAVCGDDRSRRFQFLPAVVFLSLVFSMSPRPKRLLLAKVITGLSISTLI
jgi:hypothetical protein